MPLGSLSLPTGHAGGNLTPQDLMDRQTVLQAPAQLGLAWPAESPRQGAYSLAARLIILERRMRRDIGMIGDLFVDFEGWAQIRVVDVDVVVDLDFVALVAGCQSKDSTDLVKMWESEGRVPCETQSSRLA